MSDDDNEGFQRFLRWEREAADLTVDQYTRTIRLFLKAEDSFNRESALRFLSSRVKDKRPSASRWNSRLAALRAYGAYLVSRGQLSTNPTDGLRWRSTHETEKVPLNFDEMLKLLDGFEHQEPFLRRRNELLVLILLHCALRVSELVSLNVDQVDFNNRVFFDVRRKRGRRLSAPFNDVVATALEAYLAERRKLSSLLDDKALLLTRRRRRISVRAVQKTIQVCAERVGVSSPGRAVYPHLIRHSSATHYVAIGTSMAVVQEICGHKNVTTTQRYVHTSLKQRSAAAEEFGRSWRENAENR
jgi:integrase/recombinase XerC